MNPRRPPLPHSESRPARPAALSLRSSTAGWFSEWKAKKAATTTTELEQDRQEQKDGADALAEWLSGGAGE